MEVKPVQLNKVLVTEIRAATINEAHVMCITVNRVLVIFYSVEARDRILTSEGPRVGCVAQEDQTDGSSSERGDMMVNLEAVQECFDSKLPDLDGLIGHMNLETVVEEGECPEVNRVASQETNVGEKEQVMWRGNQFWDVAGDAIESHVQAAQECFGSKLLDLDGLNGHMNLGPVGPVIPPKGSTTEISEAHRTSSVVDKLTNLKVYLKQWNRESFNCVDSQIETTMTLLNELDERVTELDVDTISLRCKA
ncbi:hypothetical protein V6N11_046286 [Hibiscus sabdariffa]|uniref:Uncharacterized protein n=1 Tax=Hibiscus sabdariffa TaxID=183260 RepID=A0ABR2A800_9ROSI